MSPDQQHRCVVHAKSDGSPFLAFERSDGEASSYSNSLFTLDLRADCDIAAAEALAEQINRLVWGVSTTVF
ncbi:hypothetical protein [Phenylobacterium koreense]|jgi:hypothetical protein|uniref:Uncharacterized protein n=1 Tax=Phenylobacterium koreense TaxID=266125 RepID=A0ABV2EJI1_9CAUL